MTAAWIVTTLREISVENTHVASFKTFRTILGDVRSFVLQLFFGEGQGGWRQFIVRLRGGRHRFHHVFSSLWNAARSESACCCGMLR